MQGKTELELRLKDYRKKLAFAWLSKKASLTLQKGI